MVVNPKTLFEPSITTPCPSLPKTRIQGGHTCQQKPLPTVLPSPVTRTPAPPKPVIQRDAIQQPSAATVSPSAPPAALPSIFTSAKKLPPRPTSSVIAGKPPGPTATV